MLDRSSIGQGAGIKRLNFDYHSSNCKPKRNSPPWTCSGRLRTANREEEARCACTEEMNRSQYVETTDAENEDGYLPEERQEMIDE